MKDIKLLISSLLIFCSFFAWYLFADQKSQPTETKEKIYVNVIVKSKTITLDSDSEDVVLLLNGQETSSGTIILE